VSYSQHVAESNAIDGFLPSTGGLHFANAFPPGPTLRLGPIDPRWIGVGDAAGGLCGGMSWLVREQFEAGLAIPPDTQVPANGSPLFRALVRRQVRSLEWLRTPIGFWWIGAFGADRTARRTRETQWPRIRATIDSRRLAMVGLVRHQGLDPRNLSKSHQVLGFGYEIEGETVRLSVYDPNWPDRDDVAVVIEPSLIRQTSGEPLFGALALG
jgi:hypothetical protein